ncbi:MAG: hypothetical protein ANABAC_1200 [Anaerolineae bacterium]|nr:MAG: hypothetical protein ANABAC_1200 [Anaerolineae bacterium]
MSLRLRYLVPVVLLISLLIFTWASFAMSSAGYKVISDTISGGGSGGGRSTSSGYILEGSFGGAILVSSTSSTQKVCSGFLCSGIAFIRNIFLPLVLRN